MCSYAQEKVWVFFNQKNIEGYNPYTFLDQKAIDRRIKNDIDIYSFSDVPVTENHVKSVTAPYKYPRRIEFVTALPKTVSGKIKRKELRDKEWAAAG